MGTHATSLPERGETIYEVMYVRTWLPPRFPVYAKGLATLFFMARLDAADHERFATFLEERIHAVVNLLKSEFFAISPLGCELMAHGRWVEDDISPALINRLELASLHLAWNGFGLEERISLSVQIVLEGMLWSARIRTAAWKGVRLAEEERPLIFVDEANLLHSFDFSDAPVVRRFGPDPSSDF